MKGNTRQPPKERLECVEGNAPDGWVGLNTQACARISQLQGQRENLKNFQPEGTGDTHVKKNSLGFSPAAQGQGERGKSAKMKVKDCNRRAPGPPGCHPLGRKEEFLAEQGFRAGVPKWLTNTGRAEISGQRADKTNTTARCISAPAFHQLSSLHRTARQSQKVILSRGAWDRDSNSTLRASI